MHLPITVVPGSSRDCIAGWLGDTLKVRVSAPPERGKANSAVERLLAEALNIPRARVQIIRGQSSARKVVAIEGLSGSEIRGSLP